MLNILSVENMRKSDAATIAGGIASRELMRRASEGIYEEVNKERGWSGSVAIVLGSGNNAGDGYCLAQILSDKGIGCKLFLLEDRFSEDGRYYYEGCLERSIPAVLINDRNAGDRKGNISEPSWGINGAARSQGDIKCELADIDEIDFSSYNFIVDCIYGTGFHGEVRGVAQKIIDKINSSREVGAYVVSADINSGLNGRNGLGDNCVHSDLTVSIGDYQPGHFLARAKDLMEKKVNCPIGIKPVDKPYKLIEEGDIQNILGKRKNYSNKGDYGYIALIGGSMKYSGAIRLAYLAAAAMRSGAGVASVALPGSLSSIVASHILESTIFPLSDKDGELVYNEVEFAQLIGHRKSIAFGMGIGRSAETARALEYLLENYDGNLIIDADGISDLSDIGSDILLRTKAKVLLTPHLKEFSRITGKSISEIESDPIKEAVAFSKSYSCVILLKGPSTIVTDGEEVYIIDRGCPGMATAGSGDVLSGIAAAVLSYAEGSLAKKAAAAAFINGAAGEKAQEKYGSISMLAGDTVEEIPQVLSRLLTVHFG